MIKKEYVKKIIQPIMEEKGFVLKTHSKGIWKWEKELDGMLQNVELLDFAGRISLVIGKDKGMIRAKRAENLLCTLDSPRTNIWDWNYKTYNGNRDELCEKILLDYRDILLKNCDDVLSKNAEELKKVLPTESHFYIMRDKHCQLAKKCREELDINGKGVVEVLEIVFDKIKTLQGATLQNVENELIAYAALLEEEVLQQYGGIRKIDNENKSMMITNIGKRKGSCNMLLYVFRVWEDNSHMKIVRRNIERLKE